MSRQRRTDEQLRLKASLEALHDVPHDHPKADALFDLAWDYGHPTDDVEIHYGELAELLDLPETPALDTSLANIDATFDDDHPKADALFDLAWDYGHPTDDVEIHYGELAELLDLPETPALDTSLANIDATFDSDDLTWEAKFDDIFAIVKDLRDRGLLAGFDYCDPDTTYEEDVTAVVKALREWRAGRA